MYVLCAVNSTWAGPQWSPSQNLLSLIVSMQTLLNDKPYHNEPGHERGGELKVKDYNDIIRHETLRVAVCDVLEHDLYPKDLMDVIRPSFIDYYHFYTSTVKDNSKHDGNVMKDPFNINKGTFNYHKLLQRLEALHLKLKSAT
jgi:ubiquitin-conjugating enzyme E2 Z